jgi:hypothetical protein
MSFSTETLRMNLKSKNLMANGFQDLKTLIGDISSQSGGSLGGGLASLPKNKARGFAADYDIFKGVTYGMEQVSSTGTSYGEAALRLFTANYTGYLSLGKYTNASNFTDYLTINPTGYIGINTTGPQSLLDVNGTIFTKNITGINAYFDNLTAVNITYAGGNVFNDLVAVNFSGVNNLLDNVDTKGYANFNQINVINMTGTNVTIVNLTGINTYFTNVDADNADINNLYSAYGIINNLTGDTADFDIFGGSTLNITGTSNLNNLTGDIANFNTLHGINNSFDNITNINFTGTTANITNITGSLLNITNTASINNLTGNTANFNTLHGINNTLDNITNVNFTGTTANITNITGVFLNITNTASINNLTGDTANFNTVEVQNVIIDHLVLINITGVNLNVTNITGTNLNITGVASINNLTGNIANFNTLHGINNSFDNITNINFTGTTANITNITGALLNVTNTASINNLTGNNSFFETITAINTFKPAGSQFWTITSDRRLKTDIADINIEDCINSVKDISVKTFKYVPEYLNKYNIPNKSIKGVIADELELTHPNNVTVEGEEDLGGKLIKNIRRVDMSEQLYDLIVVCQYLLGKVDYLEKKVESMLP